jgi:hypothetical protein
MHKLSTVLHNSKNALSTSKQIDINKNSHYDIKKEIKIAINSNNNDINSTINKNELDFTRDNRLSQIISLYSKGLTQFEISQQLNVNQSTISRDLQYLQEEAKKQIWKYLNEDTLLEYVRYIVGNNEISKKLWEIVQDKNIPAKEKTNALSLLNQAYTKRLEVLMNGPEKYMNVKQNISEIKEHDEIENDPLLKLSTKMQKRMSESGLFKKR